MGVRFTQSPKFTPQEAATLPERLSDLTMAPPARATRRGRERERRKGVERGWGGHGVEVRVGGSGDWGGPLSGSARGVWKSRGVAGRDRTINSALRQKCMFWCAGGELRGRGQENASITMAERPPPPRERGFSVSFHLQAMTVQVPRFVQGALEPLAHALHPPSPTSLFPARIGGYPSGPRNHRPIQCACCALATTTKR